MKAQLVGGGTVFHGGCDGCSRQSLHGVDFCYECQFFDAEWDKPNLNDGLPSEAEVVCAEIKKRMR